MTAPWAPPARQGLVALSCGHVRVVTYDEARLFTAHGGAMLCLQPGGPCENRYQHLWSDAELASQGRCRDCTERYDATGLCGCTRGLADRHELARLLAELRDNRGPEPGDPFDADLWVHEARQVITRLWPGTVAL